MGAAQNSHRRQSFYTWLIILNIIFLGMITTGCKNKKPIKVGFVGCLTGRLSDLGLSGRNSVILAVEQINKSRGINGRQVEILAKDNQLDATKVVQVVTELRQEDVVAIIGPMTSTMALAVLPLANKEHIVMVSPTASTNELTGIDDYFFRLISPNIMETDHLTDYLFGTMGLKRIACVYDLSNRVFTEEWYHNFKNTFENMGGELIFNAAFSSGEDFSYMDLARDIIDADPDGVVLVSGALDTAMLSQQIRKLESAIPIICSGWAKTPELIQHGGSAVEGIIFSQGYDNKSQHPDFLKFKKQYYERFEREAGLGAVYGYEAAQLLLAALSDTDSKHDLRHAILHQQSFQGLQGTLKLDAYGDAIRKHFLAIIQDGQFVTLE